MWHFLLAFLIHSTYSCENMMEIESTKLTNYQDVIGNWSYVYHWDNTDNAVQEFPSNGYQSCPKVVIAEAPEEIIEANKLRCAGHDYPFKWTDAKLILELSIAGLKDAVIFIGEDENWLLVDCFKAIQVMMKMVGDDFMVITHPGAHRVSELLSRSTPDVEQLKYIAHHLDVCTGLNGMAVCK